MKGLAKKLSDKLAARGKSARAAAVRNKDFMGDALVPVAAAVGGGVAGLVDGSLDDNTVGESPVSKGMLLSTGGGLLVGFLLRKSSFGRKMGFGVAAGGTAPLAYLQGLQAAAAAKAKAQQ